jgi:carbamoylphosphate synthase large subunit
MIHIFRIKISYPYLICKSLPQKTNIPIFGLYKCGAINAEKMLSSNSTNLTRLLITDVGHPVTPSTFESLRDVENDNYYIVGVDTNKNAVGSTWCDKFHTIPDPHSDEYLLTLLEICKTENIDLLVPWTDTEVEIISKASTKFTDNGINLLCGTYESIRRSIDKGTMLEELSRTDIPIPDYAIISRPEEIESRVKDLGYPQKRVIIKPRKAAGGHGLCILDSDVDLMQQYPGQSMPLSAFLEVVNNAVKTGKSMVEYVAMEYLPGNNFSVDVLADSGKVVYVIPRTRIHAVQGASQTGEILPDLEVHCMVSRIVKEFDLHLLVNVQLKYSQRTGGLPLIYEINPRVSGSIVANYGAGVNLFHYGIQMALGKPIPSPDTVKVQQTEMIRYWKEYFKNKDCFFTL